MTEDVIQGVAARVAAKFGEAASVIASVLERELRVEIARAFGVPARVYATHDVPQLADSKRASRSGAVGKAISVERTRGVLSSKPKGLRAEQIRAELGLSEKAGRRLTRALRAAVNAKALVASGNNRARVYRLRSK